MRVLFCTTGGLGHVLPLRPLGLAVRAGGHEVAWVTAPDALEPLEGAGFDLFVAGPGFEQGRQQFREAHAGGAHLLGEQLSAFTFPRLFGAVLAPAMLEGVDQAVRRWRPDFVVHEPAALAAPLVCRQWGLRHLTHGYGLRPPASYIDEAMRCFGPSWRARGFDAPADGGLYRHLYLDITPPSLQPLPPHEKDVYRFNPYRARDADVESLPADVRRLVSDPLRGPRIYVSFGTVFHRSAAFLTAARAAARLGGAVVITVGPEGDARPLQALGAHVSVQQFVPQAALLPFCDLVVSHGGAGTLLGAAAQGVPQLVLPQAADHFRNARALVSAHAGQLVEPERQTSVDEVTAAMADVLGQGPCRVGAGRLAAEMAALPQPADAVHRLERWFTRPALAAAPTSSPTRPSGPS